MRQYLIAATVLSLCPISVASEITEEHIDVCKSWGRLAELSMDAHQDGRPLTEQMKLSPDPRAYEIILYAYDTKRFRADDMKRDASASYRDKIAGECLTALSRSKPSDGVRPPDFLAINSK